ncbi:MAG: tellurite resistance/C4-dicarboxylate transporter family protein [Hyphomicrobium sp.]|nr:tellurite resistance/C4-dicarboxylate transporter family protein [Hyphomicrobium sp.]
MEVIDERPQHPEPKLIGLADFSAPNFGMVMATGIVSLAAHMLDRPTIAHVLFLLNIAAYVVLWLLTALRLYLYPKRLISELVAHISGPGFFSMVAATGVLGSQCVILTGSFFWGTCLWVLAITLWFCLTYTIFAVLTVKEQKPQLDEGINGGWLLAVVATQSIAVLSALLATQLEQPYKLEMNFLALSMWLWGGMLYIWLMSLIFYRYSFFTFSPADLSPPYWINMGAMAISTLAGSLLIINAPEAPFLLSLLPFLKGFTVFFWATGTWWIPMLVVLALWRHVYKRFPMRYDPLYWGAVFPLGMYSASTFQMNHALSLDFLSAIPQFFLYCALVAWVTTLFGLAHMLLRLLSATIGKPQAS